MRVTGICSTDKIKLMTSVIDACHSWTREKQLTVTRQLDQLLDSFWQLQELAIERGLLHVCGYCAELNTEPWCETCDSAGQDYVESWEVS
jgi:hypothetical protein